MPAEWDGWQPRDWLGRVWTHFRSQYGPGHSHLCSRAVRVRVDDRRREFCRHQRRVYPAWAAEGDPLRQRRGGSGVCNNGPGLSDRHPERALLRDESAVEHDGFSDQRAERSRVCETYLDRTSPLRCLRLRYWHRKRNGIEDGKRIDLYKTRPTGSVGGDGATVRDPTLQRSQ